MQIYNLDNAIILFINEEIDSIYQTKYSSLSDFLQRNLIMISAMSTMKAKWNKSQQEIAWTDGNYLGNNIAFPT